MSPVTIRIATRDDAAQIADLSRQTFYDTFSEANTPENMELFLRESFSKELLMAEVGAPGNIFLLAETGHEIRGYARLRENNHPRELAGKDTLELARIYVVKNAIGQGVGKALMEKCFSIAGEKKKEVIWLGVWKENQKAIDFYIRWGFRIFAEHDFVLGKDIQKDWLMKKNLW